MSRVIYESAQPILHPLDQIYNNHAQINRSHPLNISAINRYLHPKTEEENPFSPFIRSSIVLLLDRNTEKSIDPLKQKTKQNNLLHSN